MTHRIISLSESMQREHRVEIPRFWLEKQDQIGQTHPEKLRTLLLDEVRKDVVAYLNFVVNPSLLGAKEYVNQNTGYVLLDWRLVILVESLIDNMMGGVKIKKK